MRLEFFIIIQKSHQNVDGMICFPHGFVGLIKLLTLITKKMNFYPKVPIQTRGSIYAQDFFVAHFVEKLFLLKKKR